MERIPSQTIDELVTKAFHLTALDCTDFDNEYECQVAIMCKFMSLHNYEMTKGDKTKAFKLCKHYVPMVMAGKFI